MITMFSKVATTRNPANRLSAIFFSRSAFAPLLTARLDSHMPTGIRPKPTAKAIGRITKDRIPM
jgi:hypothetical protein